MLLLALLACAQTKEGANPGADSADSADSAVPDSGGPADTAPADDTADPGPYTHYMSTTSGLLTLPDGSTQACTGEAHLNHYTDSDTLMGFCGCEGPTEAMSLAGFIEAVVADGVITGAWEADNGTQTLTASLSGTLDGSALQATLHGEADWLIVDAEIHGAPPEAP